MPNVYLPGAILPVSRGAVRGGLAVALHDPEEIDGLTALCALAPRPPDDPIASVYHALEDPSLDLAAWSAYWRDLEVLRRVAVTSGPAAATDVDYKDESFPAGQLGKLSVALEVATKLWRGQEAETSDLTLLVLLAEPSRTGQGDLNLDGNGAALVIRPGSLIGDVVRLPLRATLFAVCLMVGGGTSTSARRAEMVDRLREKALASRKPKLESILELPPRPAGDKPSQPLVVLVHGLFATDVGTFGALQPRLEKHFKVVGYPHDTLSESIEANGFELARRLAVLGYPKVYCVAHSRGGLVARCATFGTPHLGAEMAENPGSLIATLAFLKAGLADKSVASLVDMLCCVAEMGSYPGIVDLRPPSTDGAWLARLQAVEGLHPDSKMQLFAVGGARLPTGLMQRIAGFSASRIIGRKPSDLVVAQSSSLPPLSNPNSTARKVNCDHFSYFREEESETLDLVVNFLLAS